MTDTKALEENKQWSDVRRISLRTLEQFDMNHEHRIIAAETIASGVVRAAEEAKILSWRQEDERAALEKRIEDARKLGEWRERDSSRAPGMQAGRGEGRSQGQGLGQGQSHGSGGQGGGGLSR